MEAIEGTNVTMKLGPDCQWSDDLCGAAVEAAFPAHPELNAIFTHGGMAKGAVQGLRTIGRLYPQGEPGHVFIAAGDENERHLELLRDGWADCAGGHSPWINVDIATKAMFTHVILGQPVPYKYLLLKEPIFFQEDAIADWERELPLLWGTIMSKGIPYSLVPVLDVSDIIATPTKALRMKYMGY